MARPTPGFAVGSRDSSGSGQSHAKTDRRFKVPRLLQNDKRRPSLVQLLKQLLASRILNDRSEALLPGECQNIVLLSHEFYREILDHPIPTDLESAKALSSCPAALDLFMWLSYRCFKARGKERMPLFGAFGLVSQLGNAVCARPRKFREKLERWLDLVRTLWPECPASIDADGTGLIVDRALAVRVDSRVELG